MKPNSSINKISLVTYKTDFLDGVEVYVDGQLVTNGGAELSGDWSALAESARKPGRYSLLTCTCGDRRCARLEKKIEVIHTTHTIIWKVADPPPKRKYIFSRKEYEAEIAKVLREETVTVK